MARPDLHTLSATEIAAGTRAGDFTCVEVAQACLDRIAARESVVHAWSFLDPDLVLRQARALDAGTERGPLHGVPVGIKDIIETADMPTEMGSPIYAGYRTRSDASCVALMRAAGALILGKTVTCEFAGVAAGPTTNPHDPARTPGGSSSGSAAAIADCMTAVAFGTQTAGSVQRPSSFCGIVGFKPSFGLVNPQGVKPAAESLDTVGLMARAVEDMELSMRALTGSAPVDWLSAQARLRIGLCRTAHWDTAEPVTQQAVTDAAQRLSDAGHAVREVTLPSPCEDLTITREIVNDFERARGMAYEWQAHREQISAALAKMIRNGFTIPRERYVWALERIAVCRQRVDALFADHDVLLTPAAAGEAPVGLAYTGDHRFQSIWTQLGTPSVTLPTHAGPNGMPISIQLAATRYADDRLLAMAQLIFATLGRGPAVAA